MSNTIKFPCQCEKQHLIVREYVTLLQRDMLWPVTCALCGAQYLYKVGTGEKLPVGKRDLTPREC